MDIEIITGIEGLEELEEAFTQGDKRAVKKFLNRVETRGAKVLQEALSEDAPYEEGQLSGDIHRQTITDSNGMTVRVGPSKDAFWGLFQEFGAPERNVPALHWAENAAKRVQDMVLAEYFAGVDEGLEDMKK